jgi:E-phenylitaconyl-CoA hydratase
MSIDVDVDAEGIATICINRPDRLNALNAAAYEDLSNAWIRVRDDPKIRVAIITGAGERSFCVGADLKDFVTAPAGLPELWLTQKGQLLNRGLEVWKPIVAAVNGYCLGGGLTLLFATDIRVAVPEATFGLSEVKRGILPGNGGTQRVMANLPYPIAMEMILTGEPMDAATAARWGLVNRVVEREDLMDVAMQYATKLARNAPLAVQASKELAIRSRDLDLDSGLRLEQVLNRVLQFTEDAVEGPLAFSERRPPAFEGH